MSLGKKLKELRTARDWTQNELALRTGLGRGYLAQLETDVVASPSAETFLKLAYAFNIRPEELYYAAGYLKAHTLSAPRPDTPEEIIEQLRRIQPRSVPIYDEFPVHVGEPVEPVFYIYRERSRSTSQNIVGYVVHGKGLEPAIIEGDTIIVNPRGQINVGQIVACLFQNKLYLGQLRKIASELYLENNDGRIKFEECEAAVPVIEMVRRLDEVII